MSILGQDAERLCSKILEESVHVLLMMHGTSSAQSAVASVFKTLKDPYI